MCINFITGFLIADIYLQEAAVLGLGLFASVHVVVPCIVFYKQSTVYRTEIRLLFGLKPNVVQVARNFEGFHIDHEGKEQTIPEDYGKPVFQQICTGCNKKSHCSKQFNNYDKMVEDVREKRLQRKKGKIKKNTRKKKTHKGAKR
ncbi:hypothetical protein QR680_018281 [Steinernema hermaphroditum]|uniref:Uncharacterized protein n=1 Tax=Steinernema hermaphroditum TaxID=289476 RepID=A0AA39HJK5_9BILA|nr:hypothetical protein QR680_018281 [Steinernema hermaphroditum]